MKRRAMGVPVCLLLALAACGKLEDATPADVAMQLYVTLEVSGVQTVPDDRARPGLQPYLSDSLYALLIAARRARDAAAASAPSGAAPNAEGDPFSSLPEGRNRYAAKTTLRRGDTALVLMDFTYDAQKPAVSWSDTLVITRQRGRHVVDDIRYGAGFEFAHQGTLRGMLRGMLQSR
ncbi:MAG: hypothetical protein ACK5XT_18430 [Gemmatimonas sp.]|jgi:hypothetical protein|uniref:hypothetical protein n=1 Tax=Gemmatimonas sp. TaxID=1962908 RepID=UPI00391EED40